jgi:hypothetical protein
MRVLEAIEDQKSQELLGAIDTKLKSSERLRTDLKMSPKEYYSRISKLRKTNIVARKNEGYVLTSFGIIVVSSCKKIRKALKYGWKLRMIDSLNISNGISAQERSKLIDYLLDDVEMKGIVLQ